MIKGLQLQGTLRCVSCGKMTEITNIADTNINYVKYDFQLHSTQNGNQLFCGDCVRKKKVFK